jgi:hypothetical protein
MSVQAINAQWSTMPLARARGRQELTGPTAPAAGAGDSARDEAVLSEQARKLAGMRGEAAEAAKLHLSPAELRALVSPPESSVLDGSA